MKAEISFLGSLEGKLSNHQETIQKADPSGGDGVGQKIRSDTVIGAIRETDFILLSFHVCGEST